VTVSSRPVPEAPLRLEAAPHYRPPSLADLGDDLHAVDGGRAQSVAVYWDTPDLRLARWGASLVHFPDEGWRVRSPPLDAAGPPPEPVEVAGGPEQPPAAALELLRGFVRGAQLGPVARVRRVRRTIGVHNADDEELLRVLSDEISILDGRRVAARYRQIILAPGEGADIALVHGVLTRLRAAGAGGPDTGDEHSRVLGPAAAQPAEVRVPELHPGSPLAEAVEAMVASSVTRLLRHDGGVRAGEDPEAVHQARVATRRLRSDLDTFAEVLVDDPLRRLRAELKWLGGLLGEVRDADVLTERLARHLAEMEGPTDGRRAVMAILSARRDQARRKLLAGMAGARYTRLLDALVEFAQAPPLKVPGDTPAAALLPALAAAPWRRLQKCVARLPRKPADEDLHAVRIAAKRARYAAEAAAPVLGKPAVRFAAEVAELQGVLGDFNDAAVARLWLVGAAGGLDAAGAFVAGALSERERALGAEAAGRWKKAWRRVDQAKLHRWMLDD
jgi:CHAD domain-containing protein